ncbi:MAG: hypothetical protein JST30_15350 [Armatimonadetes bacterium]|nr:hypothetical protein [Armatimonadota bacterium]
MLASVAALFTIASAPVYKITPLPYIVLQANETRSVLLRQSLSGQDAFWVYRNGKTWKLAIQDGDGPSKLRENGEVIGTSDETGEILSWRASPSSVHHYARYVVGRPNGHDAGYVYGKLPDGSYYGIVEGLSLIFPDWSWTRIGYYDTQGGGSGIRHANDFGQAAGRSQSYLSSYHDWAVVFLGGTAFDLTKDMRVGGESHSGIWVSPAGKVAVQVDFGEFSDSPWNSYVWRKPGDFQKYPTIAGNDQIFVVSLNDSEQAVGRIKKYNNPEIPAVWDAFQAYDFRDVSDADELGLTSIKLLQIINDSSIFGYAQQGGVTYSFMATRQ